VVLDETSANCGGMDNFRAHAYNSSMSGDCGRGRCEVWLVHDGVSGLRAHRDFPGRQLGGGGGGRLKGWPAEWGSDGSRPEFRSGSRRCVRRWTWRVGTDGRLARAANASNEYYFLMQLFKADCGCKARLFRMTSTSAACGGIFHSALLETRIPLTNCGFRPEATTIARAGGLECGSGRGSLCQPLIIHCPRNDSVHSHARPGRAQRVAGESEHPTYVEDR